MQLTLPKEKSRYGRVFLLCFLVAAALFLPHCIADAVWGGGYFHYAGDFNDQQINFYQYANNFVKQGGTFSWATDLGSGFVNAYSFYLLGSPFFWLTLWVPSRLMPWMMVPLLCLKMALAGGGGYLWARRWVRSEDWSMVAGCLYAFSGFTVYNIFFNHFLDVVALFPYMLASLDDAVLDGKRGRFPFWVALNLVNNYFFFAGQAVFLILYFLCMLAGRAYKIGPRRFAVLAGETLLGCAMGCVLLIPAGLSLIQNPRTIDPYNGYGYLLYGNSQQYGAILYSAFLMPDAPYFRDMFQEGILKHTSMTAYLPLVGIVGGIAFCRGRRSHPFTYIMKACILCAFVPVLNSAFYALNSSYYARWYYMPVLVLCGATAYVLARPHLSEQQVPRAWRVVALVTLSAAAFALVPNTDEEGNFQLGVVDLQPRFWGIFAVSVLGVLLFWVLWKLARNRRGWAKAMLAGVLAFSFFYGTVHLSLTKYPQWGTDSDLIAETYDSVAELDELLPEDAFYRLDAYGAHSNLGLWFDKSCLQFFNSTVAPSIMEFYPEVGVTRDVNSKPDAQNYALRGLLSVRYTLVAKDSADDWDGENLSGWTLCGQTSAYDVYQNDNWVSMGFTYDFYVTKAQLDTVPEKERAQILMRALLLDEDQIETYAGLLDPLPEEELEDRTANRYAEDCADRRAGGVVEFAANRSGFTAHTNYADQELVFFSVPYDDGFTATVNGVPAVIEKVDNGLMAVLVPAGDADIEFTYHTPGLALSARISLAGVAVYGVYLLFLYRTRKRKLNAESC
ncbi:MAG TPA: YfhO family protein [Candidatus Gemmiger excrementigallinarum]|uniref:YfhO family protein n=1 Tax=Candidatus Gemmiger excrementigallinarum TaxID=2838609 RepID=A0A9D2EQM2_9FIRM|nr:YfhO family protein [Candidatus Gemmiger excrementigallinarum]